VNHGVERLVVALDAGDRLVDELRGQGLLVANQLGKAHAVVVGVLGE